MSTATAGVDRACSTIPTPPRRPPCESGSSSAEDAVVDRTFEAEVEASLRTLSDDARRVIELVDLAGLSYAEAADVLEVPVGTVMSRLHRARRRIRDSLRRSGLAPRRFR